MEVASSLLQVVEDTTGCAFFLDEQSMQKGSEQTSAQCGQALHALRISGVSSSMEERDAGAASGTSSETESSAVWDSDDDDSSSSNEKASGAAPSSWRSSDLNMPPRMPLRGVVVVVATAEACSSWWS